MGKEIKIELKEGGKGEKVKRGKKRTREKTRERKGRRKRKVGLEITEKRK